MVTKMYYLGFEGIVTKNKSTYKCEIPSIKLAVGSNSIKGLNSCFSSCIDIYLEERTVG